MPHRMLFSLPYMSLKHSVSNLLGRRSIARAWSAAAETIPATWAVRIDRFARIDDRTLADTRLEGRGRGRGRGRGAVVSESASKRGKREK